MCWDNLGVILIDFLGQGWTINSERHVASLRKLKEAIRRKRPELDVRDIKLHHDNARPHTSFVTAVVIARMGRSVVHQSPYSPDLAPSDFHLFPSMKESLRGRRFDDLEEVKSAIKEWVMQRDEEFSKVDFLLG